MFITPKLTLTSLSGGPESIMWLCCSSLNGPSVRHSGHLHTASLQRFDGVRGSEVAQKENLRVRRARASVPC